jgi:hypothetical protein
MGFFSSLVGGVVGFLIGGPVGAVIGAGLGATKVGEKVVNSVMDFVLQPFMPKLPDMGASGSAEREQGVMLQRQGSNTAIPVVYGYRKVGGSVVFAETGSTDNKYLYVVYVFSEGVVEGVRELYIDDWQLPVDLAANLNAGQLVNVPTPASASNRYGGRVQLRWSPGVHFANPRNSTLGTTVKGDIFADAPSFTSDMVFNGLAVLFARYEWKKIVTQEDSDLNPFTGNIPVLQVAMLGKRVASLLVDTTETQSYDVSSVRYSTNPAECLLDYLRNPRYGKGLANADIDYTTFKAAARKCNQTVTYVASGIQGPILTLNTVVDTDQSLMSNVKVMLQNFRAYMPYVQGKYKLRIEDAGNDTDILSGAATIVQTMTKDDIVSDITFTGIDRSSKYNVVSVTYVDPDQKFSNQTVIYPETESERQEYIVKDGGRENKYEVTMGGITNYAIAKDFARLIFNKQRRQESCVFTATSRALELEPGDNIRINSNILNFGTDPWRVVSVKINNDMTVDLGCVRNPDDMYPYARVGEEDIVIPTYVPKGSIIYFPSSFNPLPLGLVPPTNAPFPAIPNPTPPVTHPPVTNPTDPGGGGVGGGPGGGPITVDPGTPPTVEVPPVNVPPVAPPPPPPFDAALRFVRTSIVRFDDNSSLFTLTFEQPSAALYKYSKLWWRINRLDTWKTVDLTDRGPAGYYIKWSLDRPLPNLGQYEFFVRSYAEDERASTRVTRGSFGARISPADGLFVGVGDGQIESVTSGWALPASDAPSVPVYDSVIDELTLTPILTSGVPQSTRRLRLTMTQITNLFTGTINAEIVGVRVYYRLKGETYYDFEDLKFAENIPNFTTQTFDLAGDFGPKSHPTQIIPNTVDDNLQVYNFVIRLLYRDKTTAQRQIVGSGPVEGVQGDYNIITMGVGTPALRAKGSARQELIPAGFDLKDSTQAPTNTFATAAAIVPQIFSCFPSPTTSKIFWRFIKPASGRFRGFEIRWRPVTPGSNPAYNSVNTGTTLEGATNNIFFTLEDARYSHSTKYQWQIVAKYSNGTATHVDADSCLFTEAAVPFNLAGSQPLVPDILQFELKDTKVVNGELATVFPAAKSLFANRWIKRQVTSSSSRFITNFNVTRDTTGVKQFRLNAWYQLEFQAPNNTFTDLVCYRRVVNDEALLKTTVGTTPKYYGVGPWEKVTIPRTTGMTYDAGTGFYTVNVRGPINYNFFSPYYEVYGGYSLRTSYYGPSAPFPSWVGAPGMITDMYPYFGVGNASTSNRTQPYYAEYIFVLKEGGTEGTKGLRLTQFQTDMENLEGRFSPSVDGIQTANIPKDDFVTIANYNGLQAGYGRNISEALTNITVSQMTTEQNGNGVPRINSTWTGFTFPDAFLADPVGFASGTTKVH